MTSIFKKATITAIAATGLSAGAAMARGDVQSVECSETNGRNQTSLVLWRDAPNNYSVKMNLSINNLGDNDEVSDIILAEGLSCDFGKAQGVDIVTCGNAEKGVFRIGLVEQSTTRTDIRKSEKTDEKLLEVAFNHTANQHISPMTGRFLTPQKPITVRGTGKQEYQVDSAYQAMVVSPQSCKFIR